MEVASGPATDRGPFPGWGRGIAPAATPSLAFMAVWPLVAFWELAVTVAGAATLVPVTVVPASVTAVAAALVPLAGGEVGTGTVYDRENRAPIAQVEQTSAVLHVL